MIRTARCFPTSRHSGNSSPARCMPAAGAPPISTTPSDLQVRYQKGCTAEQGENLAPCFGLQFFGRVDIDGRTGVMTVTLKDVDDTNLWAVDLVPAGEGVAEAGGAALVDQLDHLARADHAAAARSSSSGHRPVVQRQHHAAGRAGPRGICTGKFSRPPTQDDAADAEPACRPGGSSGTPITVRLRR